MNYRAPQGVIAFLFFLSFFFLLKSVKRFSCGQVNSLYNLCDRITMFNQNGRQMKPRWNTLDVFRFACSGSIGPGIFKPCPQLITEIIFPNTRWTAMKPCKRERTQVGPTSKEQNQVISLKIMAWSPKFWYMKRPHSSIISFIKY